METNCLLKAIKQSGWETWFTVGGYKPFVMSSHDLEDFNVENLEYFPKLFLMLSFTELCSQ